jgi:hypothetical protein
MIMEFPGAVFWVPCVGTVIAAVVVFDCTQRGRVAQQMSTRAPLSDEAFGATDFPKGWVNIAAKVRRIVGEQLDLAFGIRLQTRHCPAGFGWARAPRAR